MLMIGIIFKPSFYLGPMGPGAYNGNASDLESPAAVRPSQAA